MPKKPREIIDPEDRKWSFGLNGKHWPVMSPCHPEVPVFSNAFLGSARRFCSKCRQEVVWNQGEWIVSPYSELYKMFDGTFKSHNDLMKLFLFDSVPKDVSELTSQEKAVSELTNGIIKPVSNDDMELI